MDYLDTKKETRHNILLLTGYVLIAVAIVISAIILLYQAYGFGLDKNGAVVQNGLTFFSSHPNPANIYIDNKLQPVRTNTRLTLASGIYDAKITRDGYFDWQRKIELNGGKVEHYDYPFLFPKSQATKKIRSFSAAPGLVTQSPDHRWLLIQDPASNHNFLVYDLKSPTKDPLTIALPEAIVTKATGAESLELAEWADDNIHALLKHSFDGKVEYLLLNRDSPDQSLNLNTTLSVSPTLLTLNDKKYDKYYVYTASDTTLQRISLRDPSPTPVLEHVLAYKTYRDDTVLYVTDNGAPKGKVLVKLTNGNKTWTIRNLSAGSTYVVDLTEYDGNLYVAAGSATDNRVYIYKDPVGQLAQPDMKLAVPSQVLHVDNVNYLSFSANAQFIVAENGNRFGVYDVENATGYNYITTQVIDAPQPHASWMDGNRLTYVSNGKLVVFDFDYTNLHTLTGMNGAYLPAFDQDYKYFYAVSPNAAGQPELVQAALLAAADL